MGNVRLAQITPLEMFKQQVSVITDSIRYQASGVSSDSMLLIPATFGGVFRQREILSGGNVMRIVELSGAKKLGYK